MFYYCAKCANIKKTTLKDNESVPCEVCGTLLQPVPSEYLMPNGNFFKSQEVRQNFISAIQSADTYDPEIGGKKDEVKRAIEDEKQPKVRAGTVSSDLSRLWKSQRTENIRSRKIR